MHLYGYPFWATEISIKIGEELFLFFAKNSDTIIVVISAILCADTHRAYEVKD